MSALVLPSVFKQQPQQGTPLNRSNVFATGALAVVSAGQDVNYATGKPLVRGGSAYTKTPRPAGLAWIFRKNFYVETEVFPAIGTASYIEFWYGYPNADLYASGSGGQDPGFLTGSNTNQIGIFGSQGSRTGNAFGTTNQWGVVNDWDAGVNGLTNSGEVLTPGELTLLIAVRRQTGMELWRNGKMVRFVGYASPSSKPASSFICGSFIRDTSYWTSSSDTIAAGRSLTAIEPTASEIRSFSENIWQIFKPPMRKLPVYLPTGSSSYSFTGNGGMRYLGNGSVLKAANRLASGGCVLGGTTQATRMANRVVSSGGVAFSGIGQAVRGANRGATGGYSFRGVAGYDYASQNQQRGVVGTGGVSFGGYAALSKLSQVVTTGGVTLKGVAKVVRGAAGSYGAVSGTLNDVASQKLRLMGLSGTRNDMLNESTYWKGLNGDLNLDLGDSKKAVLRGKGYNGSMNDMEQVYWVER